MTEAVPSGTRRCAGASYQDIADTDTREVPDFLRLQSKHDLGTPDIPAHFYYSAEIHELEKEKIWRRTWQFACREELLPEVGDTEVYNVANISVLLVRVAPDRIKGYYNSCLHRGRILKEQSGPARELRCQFHGFCWALDGTLKDIPAQWDFPQIDPDRFALPEVAVDTWGGFVFINMDTDPEPLADYLGVLPGQLDHWDFEARYTAAHVAKVLPCNWKVAQEAFMESYHVVATHPQLLAGIGDANSQYDYWGNVSRAITPRATPSPHLRAAPTEQDVFNSMMGIGVEDDPVAILPDGVSARTVIADATRKAMADVIGDKAASLSDTECVDTFFYTVFPNFHPWGSYNRICYRFRPNGDDPETSIMDILLLAPFAGERPAPAPVRRMGLEESFVDAEEIGLLARVYFQDEYNLGQVQRGLHTLVETKPGVSLAAYQETKIRHFYRLYRERIGR